MNKTQAAISTIEILNLEMLRACVEHVVTVYLHVIVISNYSLANGPNYRNIYQTHHMSHHVIINVITRVLTMGGKIMTTTIDKTSKLIYCMRLLQTSTHEGVVRV